MLPATAPIKHQRLTTASNRAGFMDIRVSLLSAPFKEVTFAPIRNVTIFVGLGSRRLDGREGHSVCSRSAVGTGLMEYLLFGPILFWPHAGVLHDLAPLLGFLGNEASELGGRARKRRTAQLR